jgi:thiol:disulfide interchange protein
LQEVFVCIACMVVDYSNENMKKLIFFLGIVFLLVNRSYSQVHFEPLSWQQALGKARQENKMIFIDVYTTWCTYCRQMDANIFSLPEVGNFHNEHFINLRYDALKADGIAIRNGYRLLGFPTFLYLDPQGMVVKKTAGYQSKELLLQNSQMAFSLLAKPSADTLAKQ